MRNVTFVMYVTSRWVKSTARSVELWTHFCFAFLTRIIRERRVARLAGLRMELE